MWLWLLPLFTSLAASAITLQNLQQLSDENGNIVYLPVEINGITVEPRGNQFLQNYGQWCGGEHGGFQDCCDGKQCPSCQIKEVADPAEMITQKCLEECPPEDEMDAVCAWHDACTYTYDKPTNFSCWPQGNYCWCDCEIVKRSLAAKCTTLACSAYRVALQSLFLHGTACYYNDTAGNHCLGHMTFRSITTFC